MKGGASWRKTIPLIVLVLLVASLPPVQADPDVESLYVDSYTGDHQNWDERNEPSPYLADEDTGYVHEVKSSAATEGYFGFADPGGSGTINSVTLYIECYGQDTNDLIHIYIDCSDGSGWVNEGTITVDQLSYGWETLSLSTRLDSWPDIQNAQLNLYYQGVGGGDDIFVQRAYLYVDYTLAGQEYIRDVTQAVSFVSNAFDSVFSLIERTVPLSIVTSFSSNRVVSLIREVSQAILTQMTGTDPVNGNPNGVDSTVYFRVVNEFNTSMIMLNILTIAATGVYLMKGRDFAWGAISTFFWFTTAQFMLADNPSYWIIARVYAAFGVIFVVLTIVSIIRRLNPEDQYFDDWG